MNYSAIIVAAGSGTRMHLGYNKVYYRFRDGRTILEHTISAFAADDDCRQMIVVSEPETFHKEIVFNDPRISVVAGGSSRQESVSHGLALAKEDVVLVHDGARPFLSRECLERIKKAMETEQAACLMVPVKDTIKRVEEGKIVETYPRQLLYAAQTPQAFRTDLLRQCMEEALKNGFTGTDDCSLVEHFRRDIAIRAVEGSYENRKITTPEDL